MRVIPRLWNTLEEVKEYGNLLSPRHLKVDPLVSYAQTIPQDFGEPFKLTKVSYNKKTAKITCDNNPYTLTALDVTYVDAAYDQINRLSVAYTILDVLYLYWYDTVIAAFVTSNFGSVTQAFFFMDDVRTFSSATNSMLLFYVVDSELYYRAQVDRFGVEYHVTTLVEDTYVRYIGLTDKLRLQIAIGNTNVDDLVDYIVQVDDMYTCQGLAYLGIIL